MISAHKRFAEVEFMKRIHLDIISRQRIRIAMAFTTTLHRKLVAEFRVPKSVARHTDDELKRLYEDRDRAQLLQQLLR